MAIKNHKQKVILAEQNILNVCFGRITGKKNKKKNDELVDAYRR